VLLWQIVKLSTFSFSLILESLYYFHYTLKPKSCSVCVISKTFSLDQWRYRDEKLKTKLSMSGLKNKPSCRGGVELYR
jgi:hypothetical protein